MGGSNAPLRVPMKAVTVSSRWAWWFRRVCAQETVGAAWRPAQRHGPNPICGG